MAQKKHDGEERRLLAQNRQARHDYEIEEVFEAGIALLGTEVKSARAGRIQLKDSYANLKAGELWLMQCHIAPYTHASVESNHEPERPRKLLLKAHEIERLIGRVTRSGYTLIPLRVYLAGAWIKVELGLGRGKTKGDKREDQKRKIQEQEMRHAIRERRR